MIYVKCVVQGPALWKFLREDHGKSYIRLLLITKIINFALNY